tara:strand:- start:100 stop:264 length:165 start_codon:yes stop_codon:yes gene_type:complete
MFFEVRVLDGKNKIKKIISSQQLSKKYWNNFEFKFNSSKAKPKRGKKEYFQEDY